MAWTGTEVKMNKRSNEASAIKRLLKACCLISLENNFIILKNRASWLMKNQNFYTKIWFCSGAPDTIYKDHRGCDCSDGSGSKFFDPGQVGSIFCGSGRVSHLWFGFEFGKFPLKTSNFSIFFTLGQKKSLRVGSKSTRFEGRVSLLFTAGQK